VIQITTRRQVRRSHRDANPFMPKSNVRPHGPSDRFCQAGRRGLPGWGSAWKIAELQHCCIPPHAGADQGFGLKVMGRQFVAILPA